MVVRANLLASSLESLHLESLHLAPLKADELALASELVLLALASEVLLALASLSGPVWAQMMGYMSK